MLLLLSFIGSPLTYIYKTDGKGLLKIVVNFQLDDTTRLCYRNLKRCGTHFPCPNEKIII